MPITLESLTAGKATATIRVGSGELQVTYRPLLITPRMLHQVSELDANVASISEAEALTRIDGMVDMLLTVLSDWDLVDSIAEDGTPGPKRPLTRESLADLGLTLLAAIIRGIFGDSTLNPQTGTRSQQTSRGTTARGRRISSRRSA